ncbi:MAG: SpoIIE family protein phosphatase [Deltaproteobacteria bacterium]|nr:SpoIIE family protein phosphatase [Deltaproteobacteria bacterium]
MKKILRIPVEEPSQVGEARRLTVPLCRLMRFSEVDIGRISLIVTEAATNLVKHAAAGELLIRTLECGGVLGLEILATDRGPGMANPARFLQDGVSTTGSPGTGLGAIVRASAKFDLFSSPGQGTVMMSRYWAGRLPRDLPARPLEIGAICLPIPGEESCGDGWAVEQDRQRSVVLACDGLGHGLDAAKASLEAERLFRIHRTRPVAEIVEMVHAGLCSTRGAAIGVLEVDHVDAVVRFCGIGNIAARIITASGERHLVSHNGIAGQEARKIQQFTYPWDDGGLVVVHSDGIATRWSLADYPGLPRRHPSVVAGVLNRDFRRGHDDSLVLVAKSRGRGAGNRG